ncbi:hypothetical protein PHET_05841 [Paragonimus heterotremus]|uniref:Uncharacterized protein n=1 Tax=Paragonimus heterotremus TaxID=100268 RepID=A0A8J4SPC5_9TREM|nr:hypothetical protein PHET_05841 [Paragonimus heterotremus]
MRMNMVLLFIHTVFWTHLVHFWKVQAGTILSHPETIRPFSVTCLSDCCEDLEIMEFGQCGSRVVLDQKFYQLDELRIRFERILEAMDIASFKINNTENYMIVALLLTENQNIQWLYLFRSLHYLIDGQPIIGGHTVLPLWHERRVNKSLKSDNKWRFYLLYVKDYSDLPLDCGSPPTRFDLNWIRPETAVILGSIEYVVDELLLLPM